MKFKDLKTGQKFRKKGWERGAVRVKIKPVFRKWEGRSFVATSRAIDEGLNNKWYDGNTHEDDDVILVK